MFVYRSCQCVQIIHSTLVAWLAQKEKERSGDRLGSANDRAAMIDILRQFVGYILLGLLPDPNQVIHIFRRLVTRKRRWRCCLGSFGGGGRGRK